MSIDLKSMLIGRTQGKKAGGGKDPVLGELTVTENGVYDKPMISNTPEPITWDGVRKENDIYFMQPEVYTLVKVSDLTPSIDDLIGSTAGNEGGAAVISSDMLGEITDNDGGSVGVGIYGYLAVIYKQTDIYSWSVEPGTYFGYVDSDETALTTFLTFPAAAPTPADGWNKVTVNVAGDGDNTVVDVESLPTENVDDSKIYRVTDKKVEVYLRENGIVETVSEYFARVYQMAALFTYHVVESLPTNPLFVPDPPYHTDVYYIVGTNEAYVWWDAEARASFVEDFVGVELDCCGVVSTIEEMTQDGYYFLLEDMHSYGIPNEANNKTVYEYNGSEWVECKSPMLAEFTVTENGVYDTSMITWDGNEDGMEQWVSIPEIHHFYKVSNVMPAWYEFVNAVVVYSDGSSGMIEHFANEGVWKDGDTISAMVAYVSIDGGTRYSIVVIDGVGEDVDGVYFWKNGRTGLHTTSIALPSAPIDGWNKVTVDVPGDIVDVAEVPTESIDETKIYRVTNGDAVTYCIPNNATVKRLVDGAWVELT